MEQPGGEPISGIEARTGDSLLGAGAGGEEKGGETVTQEKSVEETAREQGWKPQDEYSGNPDLWVDAGEYLRSKPLIQKIRSQNKRMKELEKTVESMARHYDMTIKQARERTIAELTAQRRESIEQGKVLEVEELDKQIASVHRMPDPVVPRPTLSPDIEEFVDTHKKWFNVDKGMTDFAIAYHEAYLKSNPGIDMKKSLDDTLAAVKVKYPDKFANPRKATPSGVEGVGAPSQGDGKYSKSRLTAEQKMAYRQFVEVHKVMSHDDYFKQLEAAGYLEN